MYRHHTRLFSTYQIGVMIGRGDAQECPDLESVSKEHLCRELGLFTRADSLHRGFGDQSLVFDRNLT